MNTPDNRNQPSPRGLNVHQVVGLLMAHARNGTPNDAALEAWKVSAETGVCVPLVHFASVISRSALMLARSDGQIALAVVNHRACVRAADVVEFLLRHTAEAA